MSENKEKTSWAATAILTVAGLGAVILIWRSYKNDAPRIITYTAPAAPSAPVAPQGVPALSLGDQAENHFSAGRYAEAVLIYRKMLALEPKDASIYNELGLALHYSGKSDEALAALKTATALAPDLQRAWLSYGFVLTAVGKKQQARAALEKTVKLNPSTPQGQEALRMLRL
ncbi:MAG: hypothetical protein COV48_00095 [Elusimicrobia bacterium CG11_big_fil_rev_8_21_14_0_20_64_6]|nr:MAG: hypothetical protein COV48_00095 [Elusimicrobia bacterium CG11_big_fil_rev_8_21_14_0_20_64_6]